jgi:uncharacterized protein
VTEIRIVDTVAVGDTRVTREGYLLADARIARTGIQTYTGREVGRPEMARVRVHRPADAVFADSAVASFAHVPVTLGHPPRNVDSRTWRTYARGETAGEVMRDGEFLRIPMMVRDADTIAAIDAGERELSAGYLADLDWTAGVTDAGEAYDAVMTRIVGNHVAVVPRGRAGSQCRIGDSWTDTEEMPHMADRTRAVVVDGVSYDFADQAAQIIERMQGRLTAAETEAGTLRARIEAKDGEIAALTARIPTADQMDALASERQAVIGRALAFLGDSYTGAGVSTAGIKRAAVLKRLGEGHADKGDAFFDAAFEGLVAAHDAAPRDGMRRAVIAAQDHRTAELSPHDEYRASLESAWKGSH